MKVVGRERAPGGWHVLVEFPNAYTDGSSRVEREFISDAEAETVASAMRALATAMAGHTVDSIVGQTIVAPAPTQDLIERQMVSLYETWQRWKLTRLEAQDRGLAAGVITRLTNRETAAWSTYAQAIVEWSTAP